MNCERQGILVECSSQCYTYIEMEQRDTTRSRRRYQQHCPVARSLDVIGERWTLLIIRDLLVGPKRYKDLLAGLPGIGTNLLAARLRELEEQGLVRRGILPPPAGSSIYELTAAGQALEPVVMAIGRWGSSHLGAPRETDVLLPTAYFVGLRTMFRPEAAAGLRETYELRVGDQVFEVRVADGRCATREGRPSAPDAVFTLDIGTLNALLRGRLSPREAVGSGRITVAGDPNALERFVAIFRYPVAAYDNPA
jgi:DNA-binding HxlR family transcriptional regulator/putative sterol carrier protein